MADLLLAARHDKGSTAFPAKATGPTVEPMTSIPSSRFTAFENESPGLWEEGDRVFCRAWRSTADGTKTAVPVLRQAGEHPAPTSLGGFAHEYGQKGNLDSAWAVQPLELVHEAASCARRPRIAIRPLRAWSAT